MLLNPFKKRTKDEIDFKHEDDNEEDLRYFENPEDYNAPLEQAYAFASKTLLELLIKDRDLIGHLRSVKHYFLLDQGDFIVQFMDLCGDELCQRFVVSKILQKFKIHLLVFFYTILCLLLISVWIWLNTPD